jgi:hypothetical protein
MYCFRENSNFPFSNQKIITLVHLKFDIFPDFYRQNRGGSKLTRGSSQVNLTLIETETPVQAYFDTPFLLLDEMHILKMVVKFCT